MADPDPDPEGVPGEDDAQGSGAGSAKWWSTTGVPVCVGFLQVSSAFLSLFVLENEKLERERRNAMPV